MTIIKDGRNARATKEFAIVGVGGAGVKSATELSKVLGNPEDIVAVDREMEDLLSVNIGRRVSIGYPVFVRDEEQFADDGLADASDLFRLKTAIGKPPIVFVMAGLGGNTTLELMPSIIRTAMSTGATVLAIITLPFAFEGRTRSNTAGIALERIRKTGCSLALIDADAALSNAAIAGDLASELIGAQARVVMNVLSASNASTFGTLNTAPELLDAIKGAGPTFISYASGCEVNEYRKLTREAMKSPLTAGLELRMADYVSVIVAGPRDMSIKALNAVVSIIQAEMSDDAVLSTSFIPNSDDAKANRLRVSILGGKRSEREELIAEAVGAITEDSDADYADQYTNSDVSNDDVGDLFGAPDWLIDTHREEDRIPALL